MVFHGKGLFEHRLLQGFLKAASVKAGTMEEFPPIKEDVL